MNTGFSGFSEEEDYLNTTGSSHSMNRYVSTTKRSRNGPKSNKLSRRSITTRSVSSMDEYSDDEDLNVSKNNNHENSSSNNRSSISSNNNNSNRNINKISTNGAKETNRTSTNNQRRMKQK